MDKPKQIYLISFGMIISFIAGVFICWSFLLPQKEAVVETPIQQEFIKPVDEIIVKDPVKELDIEIKKPIQQPIKKEIKEEKKEETNKNTVQNEDYLKDQLDRKKRYLKTDTSKFHWEGYYFDSYSEFKSSPIYNDFLADCKRKAALRDLEKEQEKHRQLEAAEFLRKNRYRSEVDNDRDAWMERGRKVINE